LSVEHAPFLYSLDCSWRIGSKAQRQSKHMGTQIAKTRAKREPVTPPPVD